MDFRSDRLPCVCVLGQDEVRGCRDENEIKAEGGADNYLLCVADDFLKLY